MSKRQRRNKRIQRAATSGMAIMTQQPGNMVLVPASMLSTMFSNQAPQKKSTSVLNPGAPLQPYDGITPAQGPRQYSYPIGTNLTSNDRSYGNRDIPPFQQLRNLARLYDGIGLCDRVWLDYVAKTTLKIGLKPEVEAEGFTEKDFQKEISQYRKWFDKPDRIHDQHSWLRMALTEQLHLDALPVYFHPSRGGDLYGMEIIAGDTIKPLLDDRGMQPQPPWPAYQQYVYSGIPGGLFTTEQMAYIVESPQADSTYGFARLERIIMRVNQALRKQRKDLARFTEGNVPAGFLQLPATQGQQWTADDVTDYQKMFDALLAGNDAIRSRIKVMPPGAIYTATDDDEIMTDFDRFLLNLTVAAYGVTMVDIGFTEQVNRSSSEAQENVTYRRAMAVLFAQYAQLYTRVISEWFHDDRFMASFGGFEEPEDLGTLATAYSSFAQIGAISPANIAKRMKFPEVPETGPFLLPKGGQPMFLEDYVQGSDLRTAQKSAQLAGMQLAANPPQPQDEEGDEPDEDGEDTTAQSKTPAQGAAPKKPNTPASKADGAGAQTTKNEQPKTQGKKLAVKRDAGGDANTGMMLAFLLDPETAEALAIPGGEPASELHITLAYLGDMQDEASIETDGLLRPHTSPFKIRDAVASVASEAMPMLGNVQGIGRFGAPDGEPTPVYAAPDVPGLAAFRTKLVQTVQAAGYFVASDHDFTPHITLAYIPANAPMPITGVPMLPLVLDTVCLVVGDQQYSFKLGGPAYWEAQETASAIDPTASESIPAPDSARAISTEYRRWRGRAIEDVKAGRLQRGFTTTLIPSETHAEISRALSSCATADQVREIFRRAKDGEHAGTAPDTGAWQHDNRDIQAALEDLASQGVVETEWIGSMTMCDECLRNSGQRRKLGEAYPTGAYLPQQHNKCQCTYRVIYADGTSTKQMAVDVGGDA